MKIILDAMGGDNAPEAPVLGAVEAAKAYGIEIVLVGRGEDILAVLKKHGIDNLPEGMEISNADDVVDMHDDPASVIHKRKNSSMVIGLKMLADGQGDAFVSSDYGLQLGFREWRRYWWSVCVFLILYTGRIRLYPKE